MKLCDSFDQNEEHCKAMLENGIDVRSYLEIVDRLAERLGGEKEYRRAARMIYETMLDAPVKDPEPTPEWFKLWWKGDEIAGLRRSVEKRLGEIIDIVTKVNNDPEALCYLDEFWVWDMRIGDLHDVALRTIAKLEGPGFNLNSAVG